MSEHDVIARNICERLRVDGHVIYRDHEAAVNSISAALANEAAKWHKERVALEVEISQLKMHLKDAKGAHTGAEA